MFAGIIKDLELKSTWIRVVPKSKKRRNRYTGTERRKPYEDRGRDWSDASTSQETPRNDGSRQEPLVAGRAKESFSPKPSAVALPTP